MLLGWLLRLLLILLLVRALWHLLRGIVQGASSGQAEVGPRGVPLVRDPICGTFVVQSRALTTGHGDTTRYFCSERCRNAYIVGDRR